MKDKLKLMAGIFKALSDARRLQIIKMLASEMEESLCVTDVAQKLGISQPAASQHIRVLKQAGFLEEKRKGFRVFYTVNLDVLRLYKGEVDELFLKAFEKCPYEFSCRECEYGSSCGGK